MANKITSGTCACCGQPYDPIARMKRQRHQEDQFILAHRGLACPLCKKKIHLRYDNINACTEEPQVEIHCHSCHHRFSIDRYGLQIFFNPWAFTIEQNNAFIAMGAEPMPIRIPKGD